MVQPGRPARSPAPAGEPDERVSGSGEIEFLGDLEPLLRDSGLASADAVLDSGNALRADGLHCDRRGRAPGAAALFCLPPLTDGRIPFVQRFEAASAQEVRVFAQAARAQSERLAAAGLNALAPAAWGFRERAAGRAEGFILFDAPAGSAALDGLLRQSLPDRPAVLKGLARAAARMHAAGIRILGLYSWNILVAPGGEASILALDRAANARRNAPPAAADLAALSATIEAPALSRAERLRFLKDCLFRTGGSSRARRWKNLWRRIEKEERRLRKGGVFPAILGLVERREKGGCLTVAEEWWPRLLGEGFSAPGDFTDCGMEKITLVRTGADRSNCVIETGGGRFHLKVHRADPGRRGEPPGLREWRNNLRLMRCGLPVAPPAAWGESGGRSFFASRDEGGTPLDVVLQTGRAGDAALRRRLAREAGLLVGAFHRAGFFHRDLYACHLLLRAGGLCFIDLQRMEDGYFPRERGRIKDLAALLYSSHALAVTNADRMRFFRSYKGGGRLSPRDRKLIADVSGKARRIARHDGKAARGKGRGA